MTTLAIHATRQVAAIPLAGALRPLHDRWVADACSQVDPLLRTPRADWWERWTAIRYLADQFDARFRQECKLLAAITDLLDRSVAERLEAERDALDRIRGEVDLLGRRHRTAGPVAALAAELLERLAVWCAGIEAATDALDVDELDERALAALADLQTGSLP
jgi:hypothetical protein